MSQFGYAEEPGENKASADIYAVIPPLVIPPGIQHHTECVLLRVISENGQCCSCFVFGYLHENNPQ